ncbi:MAG TPA: carbonic anhydrase [Bacillales bacterium]|nr:carbonic anhydrase [Bacillales bacterium]
MSLLKQVLEHNDKFVEEKAYEPYITDKVPNKKAVVFTCMDTRLVELLPKAMGFRNGDVKVVKNAGARITNSYDSVVQSILIGLWQLKADEVIVVGHKDCGMAGLKGEATVEKMKANGISADVLASVETAEGVNLNDWLSGFESVEDNVKNSVNKLKTHELLPAGAKVHGLVIDPKTGKLDLVHEDE